MTRIGSMTLQAGYEWPVSLLVFRAERHTSLRKE